MSEVAHGGKGSCGGRRVTIAAVLLALAVLAAAPGRAAAQANDDQRRRELIDELLRSLIANELEKRNTPAEPVVNPAPTPTITPRTNVAPTPRVVNAPTREMTEARRILADLSRDIDQLTTILNNDLTRVPGVRPLMSDVLKLRARAAVLAQRSTQLNDHREILPDLQTLDRDWRILANRLQSLRGLDRRAEQSIQRLDAHVQGLARTFNVRPQVNHSELLQKVAGLAASLRSLIEDIEIELSQAERQQLLVDGRRVEQQALSVMSTVAERAEYDRIVEESRKFQALWTPFAARLRPVNNRYLERGVRRVREFDAEIHALLWLPQPQGDRAQLLHLVELLKKDVDDFYARAPLRLLIELPENERVLPVADQFFGVCENFIRNVENGEELASVVEDYRFIEASWQEFDRLLRPVNSRAAQQVLTQVQERMQAIRTTLNIQDGIDRRVSIDLAASLDNHAEHLQQEMGHWLSYTPTSFRNEALRDTAEFAAAAHQLHIDLVNGADLRSIRQSADRLNAMWVKVQRWIARCETENRIHLLRISSRITPALVDLRMQVQ